MAESVTIDLNALVDNLTMGEVEDIEAITGVPISATISPGGMSGTAALAFVYVLKRRENPTYTLDQARALRFADVDLAKVAGSNGTAPDPTPAAA